MGNKKNGLNGGEQGGKRPFVVGGIEVALFALLLVSAIGNSIFEPQVSTHLSEASEHLETATDEMDQWRPFATQSIEAKGAATENLSAVGKSLDDALIASTGMAMGGEALPFYKVVDWAVAMIGTAALTLLDVKYFVPLLVLVLLFAPQTKGLRDAAAAMIRRIRKFSIPSVGEFELGTLDPALQRSMAEAMKVLRNDSWDRLKVYADKEEITRNLKTILERIQDGEFLKESVKFRLTVHIADFLIQDSLIQLSDYVQSEGTSSRLRGRGFSIRFGIVGLAWRSNENQLKAVDGEDPRVIIEYGMTKKEAESLAGKRKCSATVLRDENDERIAILYLDSRDDDVFAPIESGVKTESAFHELLIKSSKETGLTASLRRISSVGPSGAPIIQIHDPVTA